MKPIIAITTGDPLGIGPEVCLKAASMPEVQRVCRPLLIGDRAHLLNVASHLPGGVGGDPESWPEVSHSGLLERGAEPGSGASPEMGSDGPAFHDMGAIGSLPSHAGPTAEGGGAAILYVERSVGLVRDAAASAIVTAPLSKTAVQLAGRDYPGHTELLADLCGVEREDVAMMFVAADLKVALLTTHLSLTDAIASISRERLTVRLRVVREEHRRWFGTDPRIAVCALNPHGGEGGLFGREEAEILAPAIDSLKRSGVRVSGPWPADTVYPRAVRGEFDVVMALFHDQATIAVKARSFGGAVNMSLGLPLLRTSVDHGTAYDIAGGGVADSGSMREAILLAARLAGRAPTRRDTPRGRAGAWRRGRGDSRR
jgi:4-hydroxythreonine-4-phosphate dehydrogenase